MFGVTSLLVTTCSLKVKLLGCLGFWEAFMLHHHVLPAEKRSSEEGEKEAPAAKKAKVQETESTEAAEETAA